MKPQKAGLLYWPLPLMQVMKCYQFENYENFTKTYMAKNPLVYTETTIYLRIDMQPEGHLVFYLFMHKKDAAFWQHSEHALHLQL